MNILNTPKCDTLPIDQVFDYYDPDPGETVEFRLIYEGPLRAEDFSKGQTGRAKDKHELRKHFHLQLRELWRQQPSLVKQSTASYSRHKTPPNMVSYPGPGVEQIIEHVGSVEHALGVKTWVEHIADDHARCGGRFVPLVSDRGGFTCALNILFLRRDAPGNVVSSGGDIDNRIKVLFDGLRMPNTVSELGGLPIEADEDPFFCLLEDDKLITSVSVTTDRLMTPLTMPSKVNDVCLIIHVTIVNPSAIFAGNRLV